MERRTLIGSEAGTRTAPATPTVPTGQPRAPGTLLAALRTTAGAAFQRHGSLLVLAALILLAWGTLARWQAALHAAMLMPLSEPLPLQLPLVAAGWALMAVAMMLPGSLPHIRGVALADVGTSDASGASGILGASWPIARFVAGYVATYAACGVVLFLLVSGLRAATPTHPLLGALAVVAPGALLVTIGLYQWTPVKAVCLEQCRMPRLVTAHTPCDNCSHVGLRSGLRHGLWCLGSCGALMLLMFALGVMSLWAMLALGAVIACEKVAPWGAPLARGLGLLLLVLGVAALVGLPLPTSL